MQTLTYGTLPDFHSFHTAFAEERGAWFDMSLNDYDARMMEEFASDHYSTRYDVHTLHGLLCELVDIMGSDEDGKVQDWAGDFASSILASLGFEWI